MSFLLHSKSLISSSVQGNILNGVELTGKMASRDDIIDNLIHYIDKRYSVTFIKVFIPIPVLEISIIIMMTIKDILEYVFIIVVFKVTRQELKSP